MTRRKKLASLALASVMSLAMAAPALAYDGGTIQPYADVYTPYVLAPSNDTSKALTATTGTTTVNLRGNSRSDNQYWTIGRYNGIIKLYANATIGGSEQMVLTLRLGGHTVELQGEGGLAAWQSIDFHTVGSNTARIIFDQDGKYLEANTSYDGVSAQPYSDGQTRQIWVLQ